MRGSSIFGRKGHHHAQTQETIRRDSRHTTRRTYDSAVGIG